MNYIKLEASLQQTDCRWILKKNNKYTFFQKNSVKDIPLKPSELKIGNRAIERTTAVKFLGVLLDENITW